MSVLFSDIEPYRGENELSQHIIWNKLIIITLVSVAIFTVAIVIFVFWFCCKKKQKLAKKKTQLIKMNVYNKNTSTA